MAIDCLAMAASTDQEAPRAILDGIRLVKRELPGVRTVLGVSTLTYLPYCFFNLISPFMSILMAAIGYQIKPRRKEVQ